MSLRFTLLIVALVAAYGFLAFHLSEVQLAKNGYYTARAESEQSALEDTTANRGAIYFTDENGAMLPAAVNQNFPIIYAVPTAIEDPQEAANAVAPLIGTPPSMIGKLITLFSRPNDSYELLLRKAPQSVADAVSALGLKGIEVDSEPDRFYPLGTVASQVLGYVGPDSANNGESGFYGIEQEYNSTLEGVGGAPGADIDLTIDPNIQIEAEKILDDTVAQNGASGGSVIVEDPQTGKILAMGATPSFDPNDYSSSSIGNFLNPTIESVYEPGSIFKVLTMAAGIDAGKITPNTTYDDKGYVEVNHAHITNYNLGEHGAYGSGTTMTQVIEFSINTGAIFAENQTGNATFASYMQKFRLGDTTGIDLPGEIHGDLSQLENPKSPQVDFDTIAYGQGIAVTPIELISAIGAIANGGVMMRPYLNAALQPQSLGRIVSASTAAQVTQMMVAAVDNVPGAPAIKGYSIGGKTGSAFAPDLVHGGYTNQLIDSYVGFGPASDPRFIILIRLNTLPETSLAVDSVVPAFKNLAQWIINYYNIPPDRIGGGN